MTVEVFKDRKKEWRFGVKASNGKVLCQSEGFLELYGHGETRGGVLFGEE